VTNPLAYYRIYVRKFEKIERGMKNDWKERKKQNFGDFFSSEKVNKK